MKSLLIGLIPTVIILVIFFGAFTVFKLYEMRKRGKRSPLTVKLLRSPGETLRGQIDDIGLDITYYAMISPVLPLALYASYLSQVYMSGSKITSFMLFSYIIISSVIVIYCLVKLWFLLRKRSALQLGLDCELAVGQELNQLMLEGCRVYHDFPADKFNIDHIVVSPRGVFAVETKGRAKPDKKGGTGEATVTYDGHKLNFPGWAEKEPLDQARRQATWLSQWLSSAVGESVSAKPVLALPGWFIDRKKPSDLLIFNGKDPDLLLNWSSNADLSKVLITRIAHQLEQQCRDIKPVAYSKKATGK